MNTADTMDAWTLRKRLSRWTFECQKLVENLNVLSDHYVCVCVLCEQRLLGYKIWNCSSQRSLIAKEYSGDAYFYLTVFLHSNSTEREHIMAYCSSSKQSALLCGVKCVSLGDGDDQCDRENSENMMKWDNGLCDGVACSTYSFCFILCSCHVRFHWIRNLQSNIKIICITMSQSVVNLKFKIQLSYLLQPLGSWHSLIKLVALSSSYLLIRLVKLIDGTISMRTPFSTHVFFLLFFCSFHIDIGHIKSMEVWLNNFPLDVFLISDIIRLCPVSAFEDFIFAYSLCMWLVEYLFKCLLTSCRISDCVIDFL